MRRAAGISLVGIVLVALAGIFDAPPLYVPGVGFALVALLSLAWVSLAARRVHVRRELSVRRVVEDQPLTVRIELRAGLLPLPAASIDDPLLDAPLRLPAGARAHDFELVARFPRRGRRRVPQPAVLLRDPLELTRRSVRGAGEEELLVLPRTEAVALAGRRGDDGRNGGLAALLGAAATDVDGLRPYREGTSAARIHWPTVARGAGLMERRLRVEADARPLVVLDARDAGSPDALDAAVRAAASLALAFARGGGCGLLLTGERRPTTIGADLGAWPAAHVRLALLEGPPGAPAPALGGAGQRVGPLVYVAARRLESLPAGVRAIARGQATLVVPGRLRGRESAFAVAGCHGYVIAARTRATHARDVAGKDSPGGPIHPGENTPRKDSPGGLAFPGENSPEAPSRGSRRDA